MKTETNYVEVEIWSHPAIQDSLVLKVDDATGRTHKGRRALAAELMQVNADSPGLRFEAAKMPEPKYSKLGEFSP